MSKRELSGLNRTTLFTYGNLMERINILDNQVLISDRDFKREFSDLYEIIFSMYGARKINKKQYDDLMMALKAEKFMRENVEVRRKK